MTGPATLILWSHALAALLFAGVALTRLRADGVGTALPRLTFVVALGTTALWALAVSGIGASDVVTRIAEAARNLAWLGFMYALIRRDRRGQEHRAVTIIYGVVTLVVLSGAGLAVIEEAVGAAAVPPLAAVGLVLRMMVAVGALRLVHHLYAAVAPRARGGIRLVVVALSAMWGVDLLLYVALYAGDAAPSALIAGRGCVMALAAPVFAIAVQRNGDWTLHLSRTVAWQTLSFAATLLYAAAMFVATSIIASISGENARLVADRLRVRIDRGGPDDPVVALGQGVDEGQGRQAPLPPPL